MDTEQVQKELSRIAAEAGENVEKVQAEVKALKDSNAELVKENEGLAAKFQQFEQNALTSIRGTGYSAPRKSIGEQLSESDSFKALVNRESKSAALNVNRTLKAVVNVDQGGSGQDDYDTRPQRDPRLADDPRRPLTLLDALPTLPMDSATFEFVQLNGYTNAAAEQGTEGSTKAEASLPTTLKTVRAATIAHWLPVSEQVLQDNSQLESQIESLLRYGVLAKAESLIVGGTGDIAGLETEGQSFTASSGVGLADAIGEAQAKLDTDGWRASHVLLNPTDWHQIRSERSSSTGEYVASGWNMPASPNIWGLTVVSTPSVTSGQPIVLDSSKVAIMDRMSAVVELFRQDGTGVRENMVTVRSEARIAFAVFAAGAVQLVSTV